MDEKHSVICGLQFVKLTSGKCGSDDTRTGMGSDYTANGGVTQIFRAVFPKSLAIFDVFLSSTSVRPV